MIIKEMMILNGRDVRIGASLLVGDIHDMVRFYRDILGFHTGWDGGDFAEFETAGGALSLFGAATRPCGRWIHGGLEFFKSSFKSFCQQPYHDLCVVTYKQT